MFHLDASMIGHAWPTFMWGVVLAAALGCCIGFYEFVWFMSAGYGFAVAVIGLYHLIIGAVNGTLTPAVVVLAILLMVYGIRLGGYIMKRELTNANYKKTLESTGAAKRTPIFVSLFMWAFSMFLYTFQTSAVTYRVINQERDNVWAWIGAAIMLCAILGEALADRQKSAAKKANPHRFCDVGLFKIVRCPNYFSEIMFWVGVTVSGIGTVTGKQWIVVLIALVTITYVMYNSAQRLELRQEKNYGLDPEYQKYSDTVPILFPFTKHYHTMKVYRD